jgi:hypothetical protein
VHVDGLQLRYVQKLKRLKIGINTDDGLTKVRDCWLDSPRRLRRSSYSTVDDCLTRVRSRHDSRVPSSQAIDHDWPRFIHSSSVSNAFRLTTQNTNSMLTTQQQQPAPASAFPHPPPTNQAYEAKPEIVYGVEEQQVSPNASDEVNNTNNKNPHTKRDLRGAAVAGGLVGLLLGGPIVGAVEAWRRLLNGSLSDAIGFQIVRSPRPWGIRLVSMAAC